MHITVDDVKFCYSLECVYVKNKSSASTACELINGVLRVKKWPFVACDKVFYAIIFFLNYVLLSGPIDVRDLLGFLTTQSLVILHKY